MHIPFHSPKCREGWGCETQCQVRWLAEQKTMWRNLAYIFDANYVCGNCNAKSAQHISDCKNPLHEIHEAIYAEIKWETK